jgi:hypothetical protein
MAYNTDLLMIYLINACSSDILRKLVVTNLVTFCSCYGIIKFIIVFTEILHFICPEPLENNPYCF